MDSLDRIVKALETAHEATTTLVKANCFDESEAKRVWTAIFNYQMTVEVPSDKFKQDIILPPINDFTILYPTEFKVFRNPSAN